MSTSYTLSDAMRIALQHQAEGQSAKAEQICREVLRVQPDFADAMHLLGAIAHQAGRLDEAAGWLNEACARDPGNPVLVLRLARVEHGRNRWPEAAAAYRRASQLRPADANAWFGLGECLRVLGEWKEAAAALETVTGLRPDRCEVWVGFALALVGTEDWDRVEMAMNRARTLNPKHPGVLQADAVIAHERALRQAATPAPAPVPEVETEAEAPAPEAAPEPAPPVTENTTAENAGAENAVTENTAADIPPQPAVSAELRLAAARHAVGRQPEDPVRQRELADILWQLGCGSEAAACYYEALARGDTQAETRRRLVVVLISLRRLEEALSVNEALQAAGQATWDDDRTGSRLLRELGRFPEAIAQAGQALARAGTAEEGAAVSVRPVLLADLATALMAAGQWTAAEQRFRESLSLDPHQPEPLRRLGEVLQAQGRREEAGECLDRARRMAGDDLTILSAWLQNLNQDPTLTAETLTRQHHEALEPVQRSLVLCSKPRNVPDRKRTLRIGYLSPAFCHHPLAAFVEPVLRQHDRSRFRIYGYAAVTPPDAVTARLRGRTDGWCDISGMDDATAANRIQSDRIDILVDLAGHSPGNRLGVVLRRPAPVQLAWLGDAHPEALAGCDAVITDAIADPPAHPPAGESTGPERIRLPGSLFCYQPPEDAPETVATLPSAADGRVTFGALCPLAALTPAMAALWGQILAQVPGASLLLKTPALEDAAVREPLLRRLRAAGLDPERIRFAPDQTTAQVLSQTIDILLDPVPGNDPAAACEALWMGVPVLALKGERTAARLTASLLEAAGLPDLVTTSPAAYVERAIALAADLERRLWLRQRLRTRLRLTPLCDARAFTRSLEDAYRSVWQDWCARQTPPEPAWIRRTFAGEL